MRVVTAVHFLHSKHGMNSELGHNRWSNAGHKSCEMVIINHFPTVGRTLLMAPT